MKSSENGGDRRPRLIFRSRRITEEGEQWVEERELLDCTPAELMQYLCAPWENLPDPASEAEPGPAVTPALEDWLRTFCVRISEARDRQGRRQFRIWFEPAAEGGEAAADAAPADRAGPLRASIRLLDGEAPECRELSFGDASGHIEVHNRGLLVVNRNNRYAIVNINVELCLDDARPD